MEYIKTEDCIIEIEETIETDNERNELEKCVPSRGIKEKQQAEDQ